MFITCDRCVMDSTAGDFQKTSNGCNFCEGMEKKVEMELSIMTLRN